MNALSDRFWSTEAVSPAQRFAFWHDAVSNAVLNVDVADGDSNDRRNFNGWIAARFRGRACFSVFSSAPHRILRTSGHLSRNLEDSYLVSFQIQGAAYMEQRGGRQILDPGDIGIINGSQPFKIEFPDQVRRVVAVLPQNLLPMQRKDLASKLPKLAGGHSLAPLVRAHIMKLVDKGGGLTLAQSQTLVNNLCSLLSAAVPEQTRGLSAEVISAWLRANLSQPDLSPAKAATALGVSVRSIHGAMAKADSSFSTTLLEERLIACKETLERFPNKAVSEIAFTHGFIAVAHFHRTFKARFGLTPRELQKR